MNSIAENGAGIWKFSTAFLAGVVLSLVAAYLTVQKDVVTKGDLAIVLASQQRQLDEQSGAIRELKGSVLQLDETTVRIGEHLGVATKPTLSRP